MSSSSSYDNPANQNPMPGWNEPTPNEPEKPDSFTDIIDTLFNDCQKNQIAMHATIIDRVEKLYEELNTKLADLYSPVLHRCRNLRNERNDNLPRCVEQYLFDRLKHCMQTNPEFRFDPDDIDDLLSVHVGCPKLKTIHPYSDSTYNHQRLTLSISICLPSVAQDKATGYFIALTPKDAELYLFDKIDLDELNPEVSVGRRTLEFDFEYEYDDLVTEPDCTFSDWPTFPTRPITPTPDC